MDKEVKVSVIIPVYNTEKYLRQCLDSVVSQTLQDIEIICVDDGSTDHSLAILNEYAEKDQRITVLTQENINAGAARNVGLAKATGKYLSFLDADDFFELSMLEEAYAYAEKNRAEITVFGCDQYMQSTGEYEKIAWSIHKELLPSKEVFSGKKMPKDRFSAFVGWAWDKLFLRTFVIDSGLTFQEQRTTNDMFFVFAAIIRAKRICVLEKTFAHHRRLEQGTLSVTREKSWRCFYDALQKLKAQMQLWDYWDWIEQDYINYAVHAILWNLSTIEGDAQRLLYETLRNEWIPELGITERGFEYFYHSQEFKQIMAITALSYEQYYGKAESLPKRVEHAVGEQPKVSIVMPSLNVGTYIRECIESVVNQTLQDIEIICVDAGSTDGTLEVLREYAERDARIRIIESDKKSYGYQVNLGIKAATGEYFGLVEADDYILPDMYETLCQIADQYSLEVLKADFCRFVGEGDTRKFTYQPIVVIKDYYNKVIDSTEDLKAFSANMVTWAGIYRLSFLRKHTIYHNESPGASYQDNGFWFQVFTHAHRVMFYDRAFYMLRRDNLNSSVKSKSKVYCMCGEYDFIRDTLRREPELEKKFVYLCAKYRYNNYNFTLDRIAPEFKLEFLRKFAEDFKKIQRAGELQKSLFPKNGWKRLRMIMKDPDGFYYKKILKKIRMREDMTLEEQLAFANQQIAILKREIDDIHNSWTYRIGRLITFIPRKVRGGIRCYREHGLTYTLKRVLVHLHFMKEPKPIRRDYDYYYHLPPKKYKEELKLWYEHTAKEPLDLEHPKTFNQKVQWLKLYDSTPLKTRLADKYLVRDWVKEKIGEEYLIPLLGVWDSFDEIDFDQLPDQFVLKANHGSGWNIIVKDKSQFDVSAARKKFNVWMKKNFAFVNGFELHYMNIPPKIIAEKYIEEVDQVYDYKFMCFDGEVKLLWVDTDRFSAHKRTLFSTNWERLSERVHYPQANYDIPRPKGLEKMVKAAARLSQGFANVRVDFYEVDGKVYFGEMTFTSCSGIDKPIPDEFGLEMGEMLHLPAKSPIPERKF